MKTKETSLWGWLRRGFEAFGLRSHVNRIENSAGIGTPDVEGCISGSQFWIELKVAEVRANLRMAVDITTDQAMWLRARRSVGGRSFLLIRFGKYHFLLLGNDPIIPQLIGGHSVLISEVRRGSLTPFDAKAVDVVNYLSY